MRLQSPGGKDGNGFGGKLRRSKKEVKTYRTDVTEDLPYARLVQTGKVVAIFAQEMSEVAILAELSQDE